MVTNWAAGRPTFIDPAEEFRSPEEDWRAFMSTQAPFWETRAPLGDIGRRLQARYLLAAPQMAQTTAADPYGQQQAIPVSFSEYLRGYQGRETSLPDAMSYYAGSPELRERARQASEATMVDPGAYMEGFTPETDPWNRAAWMTEQFNPMVNRESAMRNQLAVANMLALQRGGGQGAITGQMASAVRNAMARMQQQRLNTGAAQGSFLDWYMKQTAPPSLAEETQIDG